MSNFTASFYDRFMKRVENKCLKKYRRTLLETLHGAVLEIGTGTGANLPFYPQTLEKLVLSDPHPKMREILTKTAEKHGFSHLEIRGGSAEHIEAADSSFDFVVATLVCCSFVNLEEGLLEIRRVLKPGGKLVFMEHVAAAEGTRKRRWQNRITPIWSRLAGNCHLNRETEPALLAAGFTLLQIQREHMCTSIPLFPMILGVAQNP